MGANARESESEGEPEGPVRVYLHTVVNLGPPAVCPDGVASPGGAPVTRENLGKSRSQKTPSGEEEPEEQRRRRRRRRRNSRGFLGPFCLKTSSHGTDNLHNKCTEAWESVAVP